MPNVQEFLHQAWANAERERTAIEIRQREFEEHLKWKKTMAPFLAFLTAGAAATLVAGICWQAILQCRAAGESVATILIGTAAYFSMLFGPFVAFLFVFFWAKEQFHKTL